MKLYRVDLAGSGSYSSAYAVAETAESAYQIVKAFLDKLNLCFLSERRLKQVVLMADEKLYGESEKLLLIEPVPQPVPPFEPEPETEQEGDK